MGQSQSHQEGQPEQQDEVVATVFSTGDEQDSGADTATSGQETIQSAVENGDKGVQGEQCAPSGSRGAPTPPPAAAPSSTSETFKVPALPASSTTASAPVTTLSLTSPSATMRSLPADIEHILSLGANQPDEAERAAATDGGRGRQELEQAVREMKENALKADGEVKMESEEDERRREELLKVEAEMQEKGVTREAEVKEESVDATTPEANEIAPDAKVKKEDQMADDSDSSDSSDSESDSSSSDSDSTTAAPQGGRRNRRNRQRAASVASDIDDEESGIVSSKSAPKTEHEVVEPDVAPPAVQKLDENAEIAKFGKVESVIENVVVIKADTGGDWRVLDEGTVVCWEDRTVIGTIFETFGSVQQPFYSIRFPSSAPPDRTVFTISRSVFYSPNLASFVFTRDLRHIKGSDASNIWDEEVAAHEVEFSDDEEEAEYRKRIKAERRARTQSATPGPSNPRNPRSSRPPASLPQAPPPLAHPPASLPARPAVSYADTLDEPSSATTPSLPPVGPMAAQPPRAMVGEKPPPGRVGRRMFERDTGMSLDKGDEVEFEFSSGEGSDDDDRASVVSAASTAGRGGARGGRGGRGRGRGGQRGGGQGGRGGGPGGRPVAPLPARASPTQQRPHHPAPPTPSSYSAAPADSPSNLPPRQPAADYYAQPQQQPQTYAFGGTADSSSGMFNFGAAMQWPYAPAWPAMGGAYGPAAAGFYGGAGAAGAYSTPYGGGAASAGYSPHQPHAGTGAPYRQQGPNSAGPGANGGYGNGQHQGKRGGQGGYGQGQGQGGQGSMGWYAGPGGAW